MTETYADLLGRLYVRTKVGIKPGTDRVRAALSRSGDPHRAFSVVHIAGTNGKGSVAAMMASCLQQSGLRVGLYTSPHLQRFTERIQVDGKEIDRERVVELGQRLLADPEQLSFFETVTAMALCYFAEQEVDIAIIETGLGGRLDATNIVDPDLVVITAIDFDHTDVLGTTMCAIAGEKAGIIKRGVPVVAADSGPDAMRVIAAKCDEMAAELWQIGDRIRFEMADSDHEGSVGTQVRVTVDEECLGLYRVGLRGLHQAENAVLCLAGLKQLSRKGFAIEQQAIAAGLEAVRWPGRLEQVGGALLDVAHNLAGVRTLCGSLPKGSRWSVLFAAMRDKDPLAMLKELWPFSAQLTVTQVDAPRAADAAAVVRAFGRGSAVVPVAAAYQRAKEGPDPLLVTGSAYLVGEVRGRLLEEGGDPLMVVDPVIQNWPAHIR